MIRDLVAVDVHVHPTSAEAIGGFGSDLEGMARYFGRSIPSLSMDELAHPDVFIGFAGVDPWKGRLAVDEARRACETLGLRGLKLHPGLQKFAANDERFYPLWETAAQLGLVCLFHSGTMATG